ncbi:MAG TPA: phospholipase D-like domain-containing protein [Archangium sp.]|nr:phospholipase D-like domain-containing protein [Archangium sp.]
MTFIQRRFYRRLERSGVKVYEYQPSMMHAKTMLVDDRIVVVGSINLDFLSMEYLEEGSLVVDDVAFAADFEERWRVDMSRSREVTRPPRRDEALSASRAPALAEAPALPA